MEQNDTLSRLADGESADFLGPAEAAAIEPRAIDSGTDRPVETIADAELRAGLAEVLAVSYGSSRDELIAETARQFGYRRTGGQISTRLGQALDHLVASSHATESFGQVAPSAGRPDERDH